MIYLQIIASIIILYIFFYKPLRRGLSWLKRIITTPKEGYGKVQLPDGVTIRCIWKGHKKQGVGLITTRRYDWSTPRYSLKRWKDDILINEYEGSVTNKDEIIKLLKDEDSEALDKIFVDDLSSYYKWLKEKRKREKQLEEESEKDSLIVEPSSSSDRTSTEYSVYKNPQNNYKAVKLGWSHPGFFFGIFWCLAKQLWKPAGILFAILFVFGATGFIHIDVIVTFGSMIWMGSSGNNLYAQGLEDRGYDLLTIVNAKTPDGAIAQYFKDTKEGEED
jgi:hypothetical protein|tara:strand:- start:51 stop:878 length:828 start_codon:yes stop_codon:yes gene_type:complete